MDERFERLRKHFMERTPEFERETQAMLESLYYHFKEEHPTEDETIRRYFDEVDSILHKLTIDENNAIFSKICDMLMLSEYQAFYNGIHVGIKLLMEFNKQKEA